MQTRGQIEVNGADVEYYRAPELDVVFFKWDDALKGENNTSFVYDAELTESEMPFFLDTKVNTTRTIGGILNYARKISASTPADVFVDYAPHVNWLCIRVYPTGWSQEKDNISATFELETEFYARIKQGKAIRAFIDNSINKEL